MRFSPQSACPIVTIEVHANRERPTFPMNKSLLVLFVLPVSFLSLSPSILTNVYAQATKLNVASSGISPTQIVPYLAHEAGIFARNGLEVSVIRTRADVAVMSMLAGDTGMIDVAGRPPPTRNICIGSVPFFFFLA